MAAERDFSAALERAALRREATPQPLVQEETEGDTLLRGAITSQRPRPRRINEEAAARPEAPLRAEGRCHDIAKLTSSAILFVSEPNAATDAWHGAVYASGGAGAAASAYRDGQAKFVALTATRCFEGSILVSIGRPAPNVYVEDEDEKPMAVPVEDAFPDLFCFAVGYVGERGTLWPRSGCVRAGMNNLSEGETLGLLLDTRGGTPSITMYKDGLQIGRRIESDVQVPGPLCLAIELPHRDDSVQIVAKSSPSPDDVQQRVAPWLKELQKDPVRSSVDGANRSWSVNDARKVTVDAESLPSEDVAQMKPSIVGEAPGNRLNDPVGEPLKFLPPPHKTGVWEREQQVFFAGTWRSEIVAPSGRPLKYMYS
jgi:hypothetical protein